MNTEKPRRGRRKFTPEIRVEMAELIRKFGIRGSMRRSPTRISMATLIKIGREFGIVLPRGRSKRAPGAPPFGAKDALDGPEHVQKNGQ